MSDEREDGEAEWYVQLLDLQLKTNRAIWSRLELGDEVALRLTFVYLAPGEQEAERLAAYLRSETDYDVDVRPRGTGNGEALQWLVGGVTQPTDITLEILDAWVQWMIAAGAAEGPCAFDGWTPHAPGDA